MVTSEGLLDLLKYGEHLMLECKKAGNRASPFDLGKLFCLRKYAWRYYFARH